MNLNVMQTLNVLTMDELIRILAYGYPPMSTRASPDLKSKEYSAIMVSLEGFKEEIGLTVTKKD